MDASHPRVALRDAPHPIDGRSVLWVDARAEARTPSAAVALVHRGGVTRIDLRTPLNPAIARLSPRVACFELDANDGPGLRLVELVRLEHPRLPVLLIAGAHDEALALRALRLRVHDLLFTPLAPDELARAIAGAACAAPRGPSPQCVPRPTRQRSTRAALALIEANLHRRVSLAECARACALSACEFSRRFHEEHGASFSTHVLRLRVERAQALLAAAPRPVSEVAYAVGFNDLSYFARIFRRFAGVPASVWQALHAAPQTNG
jgi:AraC-like DNA-binding protein